MKKSYILSFGFLIALSVYFGWQLNVAAEMEIAEKDLNTQLFSWREDVSQYYDVRMDSSMTMNTPSTGSGQDMDVRLKAGLEMVTLHSSQDQALVGMQLSHAQLSVSGQSDSEMNTLLETPFRVYFSGGGVPEKFEFAPGLNSQEQLILENVVRTFTVSFVDNKNQWTSSERNSSGEYDAHYEKISPTKINKQKKNFIASTSSSVLKNAVIASSETIEVNPEKNWIQKMVVEETLQTKENIGQFISIVNRAEIVAVRSDAKVKAASRWVFDAAAPIPMKVAHQNAGPKLSVLEAKNKIKANLPKLDATPDKRAPHIHALRDLLRIDGTLPAFLLEQMQSQALSDRTRADLYLALELAATPEAQAALTSVIASPEWTERDAMRALVALAGINDPSPETVAALWNTANSHEKNQLASTAKFSLGSMASRMNKGGHPEYAQLREDLLAGAYASSDAQEKATYVYALGNTRDPELAEDISSFLIDEQAHVRRAAALSLGVTQNPSSSTVLVRQLQEERHGEVRGAIAESLAVLPMKDSSAAMKVVGAAIQNEQNEKARYSMAKFMGKHLPGNPEYQAILQNLIQNEPSKRVRQIAAEALAVQKRGFSANEF